MRIFRVPKGHRGLGDTVAMFTKATGIDATVKFLSSKTGDEECTPCEQRRKKLNELVPYPQKDVNTETTSGESLSGSAIE